MTYASRWWPQSRRGKPWLPRRTALGGPGAAAHRRVPTRQCGRDAVRHRVLSAPAPDRGARDTARVRAAVRDRASTVPGRQHPARAGRCRASVPGSPSTPKVSTRWSTRPEVSPSATASGRPRPPPRSATLRASHSSPVRWAGRSRQRGAHRRRHARRLLPHRRRRLPGRRRLRHVCGPRRRCVQSQRLPDLPVRAGKRPDRGARRRSRRSATEPRSRSRSSQPTGSCLGHNRPCR